jgi:hypothetical protein
MNKKCLTVIGLVSITMFALASCNNGLNDFADTDGIDGRFISFAEIVSAFRNGNSMNIIVETTGEPELNVVTYWRGQGINYDLRNYMNGPFFQGGSGVNKKNRFYFDFPLPTPNGTFHFYSGSGSISAPF